MLLSDGWNWLLHTPAGLATRIALGVVIFGALAAGDILRHGRSARRWKEYLFLLFTVCIAMLYGVLNNRITSDISWEYFYYGKELQPILGETTPPDESALHWEATRIGMMATWTVGLLLGAGVLIANNPRKNHRQLSYSRLCCLVVLPVLFAAGLGAIVGWIGYFGWLDWTEPDLQMMQDAGILRAKPFMAAWGVHLGGYIGAGLGGVATMVLLLRWRSRNRIPNNGETDCA